MDETERLRAENHQLREFIRKMLRSGGWNMSAIELDQYGPDAVDGEELRKEAEQLVGPTDPD